MLNLGIKGYFINKKYISIFKAKLSANQLLIQAMYCFQHLNVYNKSIPILTNNSFCIDLTFYFYIKQNSDVILANNKNKDLNREINNPVLRRYQILLFKIIINNAKYI